MPRGNLCLVFFLLLTSIANAQNVPRSAHVWVLTEENNSFENVVGNAQMPYYNQLISQYGLSAQFYSDQHSSLPALMYYVAGAQVETNNLTVSCQHSEDNVVRELLKQGYSWKSYQENLPYAGYQGLDAGTTNVYYRRHNPLIDFTDVCPGTGQDTKSVPFTQMATDFANDETVNFAYITPAGADDDHDGTPQQADEWLQDHVPAILARPEFRPGGDGILFIVWDEGLLTDDRCSATVSTGCGGRTPALVIGPKVRVGYQSPVTYHNENVLATVCAAMGLTPCPGSAAMASPMADFFSTGAAASPTDSVVISTPGNGASIAGSVHLMAFASESQPVDQVQVWDNGVKLGYYLGDQVDAIYNLDPGKHTTTVFDQNDAYKVLHQASVTYTVQALADGLQVISPSPGEVVSGTTVHVVAQAIEGVPVNQLQVWDNGVKLGWYAGAQVNQYFSLSAGSHVMTVLDEDDQYHVLHETNVSYSVQ